MSALVAQGTAMRRAAEILARQDRIQVWALPWSYPVLGVTGLLAGTIALLVRPRPGSHCFR